MASLEFNFDVEAIAARRKEILDVQRPGRNSDAFKHGKIEVIIGGKRDGEEAEAVKPEAPKAVQAKVAPKVPTK